MLMFVTRLHIPAFFWHVAWFGCTDPGSILRHAAKSRFQLHHMRTFAPFFYYPSSILLTSIILLALGGVVLPYVLPPCPAGVSVCAGRLHCSVCNAHLEELFRDYHKLHRAAPHFFSALQNLLFALARFSF